MNLATGLKALGKPFCVAAVAAAMLCQPAWAAERLVVMGHRVHQDTATAGPVDVTADWRKAHDATIEWITLGNDPLRERLFRELSLGETVVDVGFVLNAWATPKIAGLLTPLNDYLKEKPIENFGDISQQMTKAMTFGGKTYAIPYRHATQGLHYNEAIFKERGISERPKTIEEVIEAAKKLTFTRPDGSKVHGLVLGAYTHQIAMLRAMGGEFVTPELKFGGPEQALVKYYRTISALFKEGVLPEAMTTFDTNTPLEWMSQGRVAMVVYPMARNAQLNDPKRSKYAGQIKTVAVPAAAGSANEVAPGIFEFWAMAIPANAKNKDLAWSLIRELSLPQSTVQEALAGNGPVRASAYDDPKVRERLPYADEERKSFLNGSPAIPAFDNTAMVADIWTETFQAAMLGFMSPEDAAMELKKRVVPLLP